MQVQLSKCNIIRGGIGSNSGSSNKNSRTGRKAGPEFLMPGLP